MKHTIVWLLFSILFVTPSCSQREAKDTARWNEFYVRFLFIESAAFTLHGSKPMTELILDHRAKEEKERSRKEYLSKLSQEEKTSLKAQKKIEWEPKYDFEETWRLWENSLDKERMQKYIIAHFPIKGSQLDFVYIVNVMETATIIHKNYFLFQKYVGFDFDPLEIVFDILNEDSLFWNHILNSEQTTPEVVCLMGILFGYGFENSYPYSLIFDDTREGLSKEFTTYLLQQILNTPIPINIKQFSPKEFMIPGFRTFSAYSPQKAKYEQEKTEIISYYNKKDLAHATLQLLYQ